MIDRTFQFLRTIAASAFASAFAAVAGSAALAAPALAQKTGTVPPGWVGLSVIQKAQAGDGTPTVAEYPVVASVAPGSPAQTAGLVAGDTIVSYNSVDAKSDPLAVNRFLKPGQKLTIKVRRNGVRNLMLTVARRGARDTYREGVTVTSSESAVMPLTYGFPDGPVAIAAAVAPGREAPFAGAYLASLNTDLANALRVKDAGVLVVDIARGSTASRSGLQPGDVITRADSITVLSPLGIMTALRLASDNSIKLSVIRLGKPDSVTIRW
jgi:serine protease Do